MNWWRHWRHEWRLWWRHPGDWLAGCLLFVLPAALFGFAANRAGINFDAAQAWVLLLLVLALVLSLDRLFRQDWRNGVLDQWRGNSELGAVVTAKLAVLILALALPLALLGPVLVYWLAGDTVSWGAVIRLAGIYALLAVDAAMLGIMVAALCLAARQASVVLVLVFLPLCLPLLIFAMGAGLAVVDGGDFWPPLSVLVAWAMIGGMVVVPITRYIVAEFE